ncbi:MAG: restriction endonuclease subunit S [Bacteroidetes bacterium]|nr:restriction endonuclease subunit S [Bacteroidota bacterium]
MKQAAVINNLMEERKPFYNSTIPTDWSVSTVGEAFEICNYLRFPISEEERKKIQGLFPYYGPTKIQDYINEYRIEGKYALIGEDGDHFLKWKELPMTLLVEGKFNVNNHAHVIKGTDNLTEWFFYYFNHKELTPYLTRQGAGRYKLTKQSLEKIPIALPNIAEQKAITTIIRTCDANVEVVEKLIIQKELRKKWLMQQLLSGKRRLNSFNGEVKTKVVGQFIKEVSERNKDLKVTRVLSVTNSRGFINQSDQFDRSVASEDASNYKIVKKGQFAYNPSRVNVGSLDLLRNFDEGILSPMYVVFSTDEKHLLADFLYFHLKTQWFYGHIPMFVQGSVRDSLSFDGLCSMKFFIPTIEEQTAIVRVLQAADKEISLLKLKAEKLREKKKGLMQQLLTGKIRIK